MSNLITGSVAHDQGTTQRLLDTLDKAYDSKTQGKNALTPEQAANLEVRIKKDGKTNDGRSVQLVLGDSGQRGGAGETKGALEKGQAALLLRSISDNHSSESVDVGGQVNHQSLMNRQVKSMSGAPSVVRLNSGVELQVLNYSQARELLMRDLAAFSLEKEHPQSATEIEGMAARYASAGAFGGQKLAEDLKQLPSAELVKLLQSDDAGLVSAARQGLTEKLQEFIGDKEAMFKNVAMYKALGQEGQDLFKQHALSLNRKSGKSDALSQFSQAREVRLDPFMKQAVMSAWGVHKALTVANGKTIDSAGKLNELKQTMTTELARRKADPERVMYAMNGAEFEAASCLASQVINGNYAGSHSNYGNADIAVYHDSEVKKAFSEDITAMSSPAALNKMKQVILAGDQVKAYSPITQAIDKRIMAIATQKAAADIKQIDSALTVAYNGLPRVFREPIQTDEKYGGKQLLDQAYNDLKAPDLKQPGSNAYQERAFVSAANPRYNTPNQQIALGCPKETAVKDSQGGYVFHGNYVKTDHASFLASQAPKPENTGQFWTMIKDNNSPVTVCLTHKSDEVAKKVARYIPPVGQTETFGKGQHQVTVTNLSSTPILGGKFEVQRLEIDGKPHTRIHYNDWVDKTSSSPGDLVTLALLQNMLNPGAEAPTTVHCSAGIGRTGTYIAVCEAVRSAMDGQIVIPEKLISSLRDQRGPLTVQKAEQYHNVMVSADNALALVTQMISDLATALNAF